MSVCVARKKLTLLYGIVPSLLNHGMECLQMNE